MHRFAILLVHALHRLVDLTCGTRCAGCGRRSAPTPCPECRRALEDAQQITHAAWVDAGVARRLVRAAKFGHWRAGGRQLATIAARRLPRSDVDLVTWVPGERSRRARRGGHVPEALARVWARALDVPCRSLLRRRTGPSQQGLDREQRRNNVANVWHLASNVDRRALRGCRILLVDDLRTTGATLAAAARVLEAAGSSVDTFALVERAPERGGGDRCPA